MRKYELTTRRMANGTVCRPFSTVDFTFSVHKLYNGPLVKTTLEEIIVNTCGLVGRATGGKAKYEHDAQQNYGQFLL